jgi:CRP/FNR family transcriptional regulator, cyclic AMP receptor protein
MKTHGFTPKACGAIEKSLEGKKEKAKMTTDPMAKRVSEHPFLRGLTHDQLTHLADCALPAQFKAGQIIFREGEKAKLFYLIEKGKVVLESKAEFGEPVVIDTIGAGDLLGWSWMMPPYKWRFTARAVEPTEAVYFAGTILRDYCERDHSLGFELHKRLSAVMMKRLQGARRKMLAMHVHGEKLEPVALQSPFMDQELVSWESARC